MATVTAPELTIEQQNVVGMLRRWYSTCPEKTMTVGGYAGTGKTTLANQLPEHLDVSRDRVRYCSFTGKAASRLYNGSTIHRLIYRRVEYHDPGCPRNREYWDDYTEAEKQQCLELSGCGMHFERVESLDADLVIVDEASMVNEWIHRDLSSFGVPVLWIGDHGQLPPVKGSFNLMQNPVLRLETIHRQVAGSPILELAMQARNHGWLPFGTFGEGVLKRQLDNHWPVDRELILCGKNNTRVAMNRLAREQRGYPADRPVAGDRVVCLRNDYDAGVFNGQVGEVLECEPLDEGLFHMKVMLDGETEACDVSALAEQFNQRKTKPFPPRGVGLWDYGYALTVHKAQGSEADDVLLLENPPWGADHRRWLYTAITRAKRTLEIISRR